MEQITEMGTIGDLLIIWEQFGRIEMYPCFSNVKAILLN